MAVVLAAGIIAGGTGDEDEAATVAGPGPTAHETVSGAVQFSDVERAARQTMECLDDAGYDATAPEYDTDLRSFAFGVESPDTEAASVVRQCIEEHYQPVSDLWGGATDEQAHERKQAVDRAVVDCLAAAGFDVEHLTPETVDRLESEAPGARVRCLDEALSDEDVDTAGLAHGVVDPYLPGVVPDSFTLAWIDIHERQPSPDAEPWADDAAPAYLLGYQRTGSEVELRVFPGASLNVDAALHAWDDAEVVDRTRGREVVVSGTPGESPFVVAFTDGVVLVRPFDWDSRDLLPFEDQLALARSLRPAGADDWARALAGADVAPPFGVRSTEVLIRGDGWELEGRRTRPPAAITQTAIALSFDPPRTSPDDIGSIITEWSDSDQNIEPQLTADDSGRTVAWGVAPPDTANVRLRFATATVIAPAVPYANATAYAVDVGDQALRLHLVEALDSEGAVLVGMVSATQRSCADGGDGQVTVPDLVGMRLWTAVASASRAGLNVVGTGTPVGDPTGDEAVVTTQAPEAGAQVPQGACVGFRTR